MTRADSRTMIRPPYSPPDHPDRCLHAQESLQPEVDRLATQAEGLGWSPDETAFALLNLAVAKVCAIEANVATEVQLPAPSRRSTAHSQNNTPILIHVATKIRPKGIAGETKPADAVHVFAAFCNHVSIVIRD